MTLRDWRIVTVALLRQGVAALSREGYGCVTQQSVMPLLAVLGLSFKVFFYIIL